MDKIHLIFEGKEEVLNVVERGDPLVEILGIPNKNCPLIGSEIEFVESIGKGKFGEIFSIKIPGKGEKLYAVKKTEVIVNKTNRLSKEDVLQHYDYKVMKYLNPRIGGYKEGEKLRVSNLALKCLTKKDMAFANHVLFEPEVFVPKGSYLCPSSVYSETYIGMLLGEDYRIGDCINFFNVFAMITCKSSENIYTQYIFMDKIDENLQDVKQCISSNNYENIINELKLDPQMKKNIQDGIFLQTVFAIAFYQRKYNLSHNDLHGGNIFLEFVKNETEFNGVKLINADYYRYKIGNRDIYFPATPVLVKIGDFGISVKYKPPIIGDVEVFTTGYDQYDGQGPWIPNSYTPQYDIVYNLISHVSYFGFPKPETFLFESMDFLIPNHALENLSLKKRLRNIVNLTNSRPILEKLQYCRTSEKLLMSNVVKKRFCQKPKRGKIVTLGIL